MGAVVEDQQWRRVSASDLRRFMRCRWIANLTVAILSMAPLVARAARARDSVHGFSVNCPRGWYAKELSRLYPKEEFRVFIVLRNFRNSVGNGLTPKGGAKIAIGLLPPWIDEHAKLIERHVDRATQITGSTNPARVEGSEAGEHFLDVALRRNRQLFFFGLEYYEGDPKGERYKQVLADVINSLRVDQPSREPTQLGPTVTVEVGSAQGAPGERVTFVVTLHTSRNEISGVSSEIALDAQLVAAENGALECRRSGDLLLIDRGLDPPCLSASRVVRPRCCLPPSTDPKCPIARVVQVEVAAGARSWWIPDGAALYTCNLTISPTAAPGHYPLVISHLRAGGEQGIEWYPVGRNGELVVAPGAHSDP